ncbi:MAG: DNA polymerase I [bacterium]
MPGFYAIDTMAVLYRSHFAMIRNPLINSRGVNVSGLHGLVWTLVAIVEREQPEYLAVVSDGPEATFRHKRYPEYKATREKMPDELVAQLPYIPRLVESLRLPYLLIPGFEADDIIGTLVGEAERRGLTTYMVTGDKDFMQLIGDRAFMFSVKGEETKLVDREGVMEKFGCGPEGVIEVLALMGDSSDNGPGVRGVGEKTATKLVQQFGTLERIYEHLDEVKGDKLRENLETHKEMAFLSRELVTICRDVPLTAGFDDLEVHPEPLSQNEAFLALLTELEFQTFRDRLLKQRSGGGEAQEAAPQADYHTLDTVAAIEAVLPRLREAEMLVFDTETTGLDIVADRVVGMSFAVQAGEAFYVPLNAPEIEARREEALELLRPVLESSTPPKAGHNIKYDAHLMLQEGIELGGIAHDTMIASHLIEPSERRHDLDSVALRRLGVTKIPTESLIGKGKNQVTMADLPIEQVSTYACEDAEVTYRLMRQFVPQLEQMDEMSVFRDLEMPLVPVLVRMERAGVSFDSMGAARLSKEMEGRLEGIREEIYDLAGDRDFNINSIVDLQQVLYEKLKLHQELGVRPKKIKTGNGFSTDEDTLERMREHPLPRKLLEYRSLTKLKNTYLDQLPTFVSPVTGKIHSNFRQTGAATGRLASDKPNLQNIPVRSEEGRKVRALFVSSGKDRVILSADYSQIELRVVADFSGDATFLEAFQSGQDIHALTAAAIFQVPPDKVERGMRDVAKEVNFGLIYRMGPDRLAQVTGRSKAEARDFIDRFFQRYGAVRELQEELMARARKEGFALTRLGRRRYLPEINDPKSLAGRTAEGMAINSPIQGTAAEIIKLAMIEVDRRLREGSFRSQMVLSIHDELLFDVQQDELDAVRGLAVEAMEQAMELKVPLEVDVGVGENWLAAKS